MKKSINSFKCGCGRIGRGFARRHSNHLYLQDKSIEAAIRELRIYLFMTNRCNAIGDGMSLIRLNIFYRFQNLINHSFGGPNALRLPRNCKIPIIGPRRALSRYKYLCPGLRMYFPEHD